MFLGNLYHITTNDKVKPYYKITFKDNDWGFGHFYLKGISDRKPKNWDSPEYTEETKEFPFGKPYGTELVLIKEIV